MVSVNSLPQRSLGAQSAPTVDPFYYLALGGLILFLLDSTYSGSFGLDSNSSCNNFKLKNQQTYLKSAVMRHKSVTNISALFSTAMTDLITMLKQENVGIEFRNMLLPALLYADDIILMANSEYNEIRC